jgi:hypothetical protein
MHAAASLFPGVDSAVSHEYAPARETRLLRIGLPSADAEV